KNRIKLHSAYLSLTVIAGDLLFLATHDGRISALDRHDWKERWQIEKSGYRFDYGYSAVSNGMIYFGGDVDFNHQNIRINGSVFAVDAMTGKQKWRIEIEGSPTAIAIADEIIYFGDDAHHLFAVNAKNGKEVWKFTASDNIRTPAIMDGAAFFSDRGGNLYAVDLKNGKGIWKAAKRNKVATALAAYNKLVYYGGTGKSCYTGGALPGGGREVYRATE